MKKENDGIDFKDLARRSLKVENYPAYEYNFFVKGGTTGLQPGQVAQFVLEPGEEMLTHYTDDQMCKKKAELIKAHRDKFYPSGGIEIDDDMKSDCPTLKDLK